MGYSNPTPFNTPGEYSEYELARKLEKFAGLDPLVLVCHCPPYSTPLDRLGPGRHAGSRSIAEYLTNHPPAYFFCGHIHECAGVQARFGPTRAVSLGKKGFLLDLD